MFQLLEEKIVTYVKNELKWHQKVLSSDPQSSETQREEADGGSREAFLKILLHFLKSMKEEELANCLQSSKDFCNVLTWLKSNMTFPDILIN